MLKIEGISYIKRQKNVKSLLCMSQVLKFFRIFASLI